MRTITIDEIRTWRPCYDPVKYIPEGWSGTALDLAQNVKIPFDDVLWCICRKGILDLGLMRRFAAWCATEALFVANQTDSRSWNAVTTAVKYSLGETSQKELETAGAAARYAANDKAMWAAGHAANAAAWDAAMWAPNEAAWDAASDVQAAQRTKLISMLKGESDFTLSDLLNNYQIERT